MATEHKTIAVCKRSGHDEWMIEWPDGAISVVGTPEAAYIEITKWSRKRCTKKATNIITRIDWFYNDAKNFVAPDVEVRA